MFSKFSVSVLLLIRVSVKNELEIIWEGVTQLLNAADFSFRIVNV